MVLIMFHGKAKCLGNCSKHLKYHEYVFCFLDADGMNVDIP